MNVRPGGLLARIASAIRPVQPWLHVTAPPRVAQFLVAAGARPEPGPFPRVHSVTIRVKPTLAGEPPPAFRTLPCYLVVDTSASMSGEPITEVNEELQRLQMSLLRDPILAEVCQFSLITFNKSARVQIDLADISRVTFTPLQALGTYTDYSAPFNLLRPVIARDMDMLQKRGVRPYRPVVFFLSDGQDASARDWREPLRRLTDKAIFPLAPNIIAFGFGQASEQQIREVGTTAAYMPEGSQPAQLAAFIGFIFSSLTASVTGASRDRDDVLVIPEDPPFGWQELQAA